MLIERHNIKTLIRIVFHSVLYNIHSADVPASMIKNTQLSADGFQKTLCFRTSIQQNILCMHSEQG